MLSVKKCKKYYHPYSLLPVVQSGIYPLTPTLVELYLEVLKEDDALLRSLSLQGLGHFVGIQMNHQDLEKVNQSLLGLLQQSSTTGHTVEEIGRFFNKCAEKNENWFVEQVLVKLLDMAISGKLNIKRYTIEEIINSLYFRQSQCDLSFVKIFTSIAPDPYASGISFNGAARTIRTGIAIRNAQSFGSLCTT